MRDIYVPADMFISFDYGKTFAPIENPIPYQTGDPFAKCGYSPSLFFSDDGTTRYFFPNGEYRKPLESTDSKGSFY